MAQDNKKIQPRHGRPGGPGAIGMPVQKSKNFSKSFKRLIKYLAPQKIKLISVFILAIGSTIFSIVGPKILGLATNILSDGVIAKYNFLNGNPDKLIEMPSFDLNGVARICVILVGIYLLSAFLSFVMSFIMSDCAQNTVKQMRSDVKEKLNRLPLNYYDTRTHGEILSRVTNDMDNIANTLQQSLAEIIRNVVSVIGILFMMITISPILTLIALITIPLSAIAMSQIIKHSQRYFKGQQEVLGEINGHVEEMIGGHKIIKAFNKESDSIRQFEEYNEKLFNVGWKAQFVSSLVMPITNIISRLGYVFICIFGGVFVANGTLKVGDVQAFLQYMNNFSMPITQIANIANIIQSTVASAERVFEVLDETEEVKDIENAKELTNIKGNVKFENVKFSYKVDEPLINNLSINVKSGQTVAIVGPTGAGKTTLVNLLMRFYEINGGAIKIDDTNITDMKRDKLRSIFGMVLQDTWLFNGSIYDNIRYGNDNATKEDVLKAAKSAHVQHFIGTLPDGFETKINEEASNISSGEKQLLTIARAILADPKILILDEATSNVDTRTEVLIQEAMDNLMENRTSFIIAHRLSTIRNADLIIVMNHGDVVEQGNHKELLEKKGFYAELYNSQFA